jgi:hypothetical protein
MRFATVVVARLSRFEPLLLISEPTLTRLRGLIVDFSEEAERWSRH